MEELLVRVREAGIKLKVVEGQLKVSVPIGTNNPEIISDIRQHKEQLVSFLSRDRASRSFQAISHAPSKSSYPLSSAQKRLYFLQELDRQSTAYNIPQILELKSEPDIHQLTRAFQKLINRHSALRTSFKIIDEGPVQCIADEEDFQIDELQVKTEKDFHNVVRAFVRPFDLAEGPLLRAVLVRVSDPSPLTFLLIDIHHIITDGASNRILASEIFSLYNDEELPAAPLQYVDYLEWKAAGLTNEETIAHKDFWQNQFQGQQHALQIPQDYPRKPEEPSEGGIVSLVIDGYVLTRLRSMARQEGATAYTLLLSLCNVWLSKVTGHCEIVVGCPVLGRNHSDLENIIGLFVNTLPLRNTSEPNKSFRAFLREVTKNTINALDHQDYAFEDLVNSLDVERDISRNPLFDVLLKVDDAGVAEYASKFHSQEYKVPFNPISKFDLSVLAIDSVESISIEFLYNCRLFTRATLEKFTEYFLEIARAVSATPDITIEEIAVLNEEEKNDVARKLKQDLSADSRLETIQSKISKSFGAYAYKVAIEYRNHSYSYNDLNQNANLIADRITVNNIVPKFFVGILCEDRYNLISCILGVVASGCVFVPLHNTLPDVKIVDMIDHLSLRHVLTDMPERLKALSSSTPFVCHDVKEWLNGKQNHRAEALKTPLFGLDDALYVYFTSGSTGKPKAIVGKNKSLSHFVDWEIACCNINTNSRISQLIAPGFDAFLRDLFVSLCAGATLCIPPDDTAFILGDLVDWIEENRINVIHCVPSVFRLINTHSLSADDFPALDYILLSGEPIIPNELTHWFNTFGSRITLINLYGATETTMVKSFHIIHPLDTIKERIPIGRPIPNTQLVILDNNGQPCAPLIHGEICIRTPYRTLGYYDHSMNAESFMENKWTGDKEDLIYRTGDYGRQLLDGTFELLGRKDDQVKIKGNRVELNEINNCVVGFGRIVTCVSMLATNSAGQHIICSYFQSAIEEDITKLRVYLATALPTYMIPGFLCQVNSMPLLPNGKLDKKSLPVPEFKLQSQNTPPRNILEAEIAKIWSDVLDITTPGIIENFFAIGGDSLKSMLIVSRMKTLGYDVSIRDIFNTQTIEALALLLQNRKRQMPENIITPIEKRNFYPLSSAQQRQFLDHVMNKNSLAYNMYNAFEISKSLDVSHIRSIFYKLTQRHEILRTSFHYQDNSIVQLVHDTVNFDIEHISLEDFSNPLFFFKRPFDLEAPPLFRIGHVTGGKYNLLLIDIHHIVSDGVSNLILLDEFKRLANGEKLAEPELQYKDYAVWQNRLLSTESYAKQKDYWLQIFQEKIPKLQLFHTWIPSNRTDIGRSICFQVGEILSRKLVSMSREKGISIFSLLLAVQGVVLQKLSGHEDIVIGFPSTGRNHIGTEKMIGVFINTIALRLYPKTETCFNDFVTQVTDHLTEALDNQDFQFQELIEKLKLKRDNGRNPLFNVLMVMQNHFDSRSAAFNFTSINDIVQETEDQSLVNDLFIRCIETQDNLLLNFQYRPDMFSRASILKIFRYFKEIAASVVENDRVRIGSIAVVTPARKASVAALDADFDL